MLFKRNLKSVFFGLVLAIWVTSISTPTYAAPTEGWDSWIKSFFVSEKTTVLIIDSPVDYAHPDLAPFMDLQTMEQLLLSHNGQEMSWKEATDQRFEEIRDVLNESKLSQNIDLLDRMNDIGSRSHGFRKVGMGEILGIVARPKKRKTLEKTGRYLHGTHVAGIAMKGHSPEKIRLLTVPLGMGEPKSRHASSIRDLEEFLEKEYQEFMNLIRYISEAIDGENIQVVNISLGFPKRNVKKYFSKYCASSKLRWFHHGHVRRMVEKYIDEHVAVFQEVITSHPKAVFVLGTGNEGKNLDGKKGEEANFFSRLKGPNVIFVAALNEKGKIASFSNYGDLTADVAAQGVSIESARVGGGSIHMQGTSMATPVVTNKIAKIRFDHPEFNAQESIEFLLNEVAKVNDLDLNGKVKRSCFLPLSEDFGYLDPFYGLRLACEKMNGQS